MFECGDKVICVIDWSMHLVYGEEYKILYTVYNTSSEKYLCRLDGKGDSGYSVPEQFFATQLEFRKNKIEKLKERICLKKVK